MTYLQQIFLIEGTHVQVVIPQNIPKFQELLLLNYHPWFFLERVSAIQIFLLKIIICCKYADFGTIR